MANKYSYAGYLSREDIKEDIVLVDGSNTDYISISGILYKQDVRGLFFTKKNQINKHNGYVYTSVTFHCFGDKPVNKNRRLHVLLAKAFIENPNNYPVVGHKDNNKENYNLSNLYWTTHQENTQKAFDDGLVVNAIGIEDSQSIPIGVYNKYGNLIAVYGSIIEAGNHIKGSSASSIAKVVDNGATTSIKGFIYKSITRDFYFKHKELQFLDLETKYIQKVKSNIKVTSPDGGVYIFASQKETGMKLGIQQSTISNLIKKGKDFYGWFFCRTNDPVTETLNVKLTAPTFPQRYSPPVVGDIYRTNRSGDVIVTKYVSNTHVVVKFIDSGNERVTTSQSLREGKLRDVTK